MKSPDYRRFLELIAEAFAGSALPKPFHKPTNFERILGLYSAVELDDAKIIRMRRTLGGLILGQAGEKAFEEIYRTTMHSDEVEVVDDRTSRSDADYIMKNGGGRPLYRINIKMHGSLFRRAKEVVDIEPEDCFPLATYKIGGALSKHQNGMPYLFIVVTNLPIRAEDVGARLPEEFINTLWAAKAIMTERKRETEERFIELYKRLVPHEFEEIVSGLLRAKWFVLSAPRANKLMMENLFQKVFALRVPAFAQNWRNAEVDMHFSFHNDMMQLQTFLEELRDQSPVQIGLAIGSGRI